VVGRVARPPREELLAKLSLPWLSRGERGAAPQQQVRDSAGPGWTRSESEAAFRQQQLRQSAETQVASNSFMTSNMAPGGKIEIGAMTPLWFSDALILARRVRAGGDDLIQGCWLDWPAMKTDLLSGVADLLPSADLVPCPVGASGDETRRLAALPLRMEPNEAAPPPDAGLTAIRLALLVAWTCVLLGAAAVGFVMSGTLRLSERRAAFVSAVTHELRTPLTTFRLYTDLLADNGADGAKRERYVATIRNEADRLQHLVENVLSYARLERGRAGGAMESIPVGELLDRARERLARRAEQSGMHLTLDVGDAARAVRVCVDPSAFERVLYNLVDNACKYAARAADRTIRVAAQCANGRVDVTVRDRGPGIATSDARRLFRPFHKSARDAAHTAPGVGLGLALSRRLVRGAGGELCIDTSIQDGACFVVRLVARD
jgi:signal transduction histidine kinase